MSKYSVEELELETFQAIDALELDPYETLGAQTIAIGMAYLLRASRSTIEKEYDGALLLMYDTLFPEA